MTTSATRGPTAQCVLRSVTVEGMNLTTGLITGAAMISVAGLPFVMAWVEQTLMTNTRVKPPRS